MVGSGDHKANAYSNENGPRIATTSDPYVDFVLSWRSSLNKSDLDLDAIRGRFWDSRIVERDALRDPKSDHGSRPP